MNSKLQKLSLFLSNSRMALWIILYIGLLHGAVYAYFIPPWQHYDEPGHFEYAWLLAHHSWPVTEADVNMQMRSDVVASMAENNFFANMDIKPTWIAVPQFVDPPLYHLAASLPVRLFPSFNVTDQLYLMRMVSLVFLLISIAAAWAAVRELTPPANPLRWMTPLFLALLPGFVDLMTSVNNDSAAVAFCCLFFWVSVCLIQRGFHWSRFFILLLVTVLGFFSKKSAWFLGPFLPVVLALALVRPSRHWMIWTGGAVLAVAGIVTLFSWGDARYWYRATDQFSLTRSENTKIVNLPYSFRLEAAPGQTPALWQNVPFESSIGVAGKTVTIGGWVWASRPLTLASPGLVYHGYHTNISEIMFTPIEVGQNPRFISFEVQVPQDTIRTIVVLKPLNTAEAQPVEIYYSGLFMVEGACQLGEIPKFTQLDGSQGTWCGRSFNNLIRNSSAQEAWFAPRAEAFQMINRYVSVSPSSIAQLPTYLLDREGFNWYDRSASVQLFDTFWAKFSWGNVPLLGSFSYSFIKLVVYLSAIGALLGLILRRKIVWSYIFFVLIFGTAGWFAAFIAGIYFGGMTARVVTPVARYAYPVIIPTAMAISMGWWEWVRQIGRRKPVFWTFGMGLYLFLLLLLDIYSLYSIAQFYYWTKVV